jgi:hypothetical protein
MLAGMSRVANLEVLRVRAAEYWLLVPAGLDAGAILGPVVDVWSRTFLAPCEVNA